jgi:hypothetical protein
MIELSYPDHKHPHGVANLPLVTMERFLEDVTVMQLYGMVTIEEGLVWSVKSGKE